MSNSRNLKLKAAMVARGVTAHELADMIGICYSSVLHKLAGSRQFTVDEVQKVRQGMHLTAAEAAEIFFHDSP